MAVVHRALMTWFLVILFVIMINFKMDSRAELNWFVVFAPMFIWDVKLITFLSFNAFRNSRRRNGPTESIIGTFQKKAVYLSCVILKLLFQVTLGLKLQYFASLHVVFVMIPLWILFVLLITSLIQTLYTPTGQTTFT